VCVFVVCVCVCVFVLVSKQLDYKCKIFVSLYAIIAANPVTVTFQFYCAQGETQHNK